MTQPVASHQNLIYASGVAGRKPTLPVNIEQLESEAMQVLSSEAHSDVSGGAGGCVGSLGDTPTST